MEEKLQELLNEYKQQLDRHEDDIKDLESKMQFYSNHKLEEEMRIARVKYDASNMAIYRWGNMHKQIQEVLNDWNS